MAKQEVSIANIVVNLSMSRNAKSKADIKRLTLSKITDTLLKISLVNDGAA